MINPVQQLLHKYSNRKKLNILCGTTHERYQQMLAETGHNFYAVKLNEHFKKWDSNYGKMPDNYLELPDGYIPPYLSFDLVLSQHKFGQYQALAPLAHQLHLPLVSLEHTTYVWKDGGQMAQHCNKMRGNINVFISNDSIQKWSWKDEADTKVIHHGVNTTYFSPDSSERQNVILTVANDYIGRDYVLNYTQYAKVTKDLPTRPVGDTPGLSKPAKSTDELLQTYRTSSIFLNTAHLSPIPSSLLEAAACECAIVTCGTCAIPEFFTHNVDALICDSDDDMRAALEFLLKNEERARELGKNARKTILNKCNLQRFVSDWNKVFQYVSL